MVISIYFRIIIDKYTTQLEIKAHIQHISIITSYYACFPKHAIFQSTPRGYMI